MIAVAIMNIIAGLVLAIGILPNMPGIGKSLEKVAKWLGGFQAIIGIIAIIVGIIFFSLIQGTVAIIAGIILAIGILESIPALGKYLAKLVKWLGGFQAIIGIIVIIVGILGLVGLL